ncbi:TetR family transcriptional regulator [Tamaricihabitans halophyticus]|uniref:TetR family transcriptional regulator n=1 Tax=Tamaricihabitans halophyticus TaxID=1262583 RepID=A0A4R2QQI1_9PSEU|nr:TetR/AcrR family transcriptional regulator [Tamaricihabitans halophyticus]TCP52002.1 TetR family transcriptional regulator [Tamaricihabitans halophyticus]
MTSTPAEAARSSEDALARAARELFTASGYADAHVTGIANAAGVSLSRFYARFGSKERAYREIMGAEPPEAGEAAGQRLSGKARRTRQALLVAARTCIERDGYHPARINDIAELAGTSVGTFYTYFSSKQDVFTEVTRQVVAELQSLGSSSLHSEGGESVRPGIPERIEQAIRRYIAGYERYVQLVLRVDEAVAEQPELMPLRLAAHHGFAERIAASLRRWQEAGIVDPELDAEHAGHALAAMVGHATRVWLTFGEKHDRETAIRTLTRLWTNGIGLRETPRPQPQDP